MLLHIGGNISIEKKDIIAIYNLNTTKSIITDEFLKTWQDKKNAIEIEKGVKNKSMVILEDKIYLSPISSSTLHKRAAEIISFDEAYKPEK